MTSVDKIDRKIDRFRNERKDVRYDSEITVYLPQLKKTVLYISRRQWERDCRNSRGFSVITLKTETRGYKHLDGTYLIASIHDDYIICGKKLHE